MARGRREHESSLVAWELAVIAKMLGAKDVKVEDFNPLRASQRTKRGMRAAEIKAIADSLKGKRHAKRGNASRVAGDAGSK